MRAYGLSSFLSAVILLILFATYTLAQTRVNSSGTGGIHTIQGKIYTPSGPAAEISLTVRLESTNTGGLSLMTDQSGSYVFQNIAPGNYTIVVDGGDNFEIARESITIDQELQPPGGMPRPPNPKTFTVPIFLRQKHGAAPPNNQIISARLSGLPKDAVNHFQKGLDLERNNRSDEAEVEFKIALIAVPNFYECYIEVGKMHLRHGKFDDAATAFRNAIRIDQNNFDAHVNLGITLMNAKKFDEAEPELVAAALLNKSAVTPHYYIGVMYTEKKQYDVAQKAFETARGLPGGDKFPLLHRYLGGIYISKGLNKQAVDELDKYLQLAPDAKDADKIRQTISGLKAKPEKLNVFS